MFHASAGLWILLLGSPDPAESLLKQEEWHAEIVFRRSEARTEGNVSWSRDHRAVVRFKMVLNKNLALIHSSEREWNKEPPKNMTPEMRKAYDAVRESYQKSLGLGVWMGDMKQEEELWLTETREVRKSCGGGCGRSGCNATGSELTRRSGYVKRGPEIPKLPKGFRPKSFADINHIPGVNLNTLSIDIRRKTLDFKVAWNESLMVNVLSVDRKPHGDGGPGESKEEQASVAFPEIALKDYELRGTQVISDSIPVLNDRGKEVGRIEWTLSPKPLPPVELLVQLEDYGEWRPEGSMSEEEAGNAIMVHASLEAPGGGSVADKATSMWFLLKDVSSEPGICINYPPKPKFVQESDLKFVQDHNVGPQVSVGGVPLARWRTDTSAALEYEDMPGRAKITQGKAYVSAFDWGAFGILEVHAYLESGRKVYGALRSEPGRTRIRIPKSQDGSRIADGWKEKTNATGADDADDDAEPEGDARYKGDGLTLYEEYRGWHEDGVRQADEFDGGGDPNRKELFLHDASGMDNKLSLHVFGGATGLRLIWKLRESELSAGQVINFNHREGPHKVDQHAVKIVTASSLGSGLVSHAPGTPGRRKLAVVGRSPWWSTGQPAGPVPLGQHARTLFHELLHSCNVKDHGQPTPDETSGVSWTLWTPVEHGEPILMEGTVPIRVHDEKTGNDVTSIYVSALQDAIRSGGVPELRVRIGAWQGACSGEPTCVMSFPGTTYFRSRRSPNVRYLVAPDERDRHSSLTICKDRDALSYNDSHHGPESHFGLPADGRPPCLKQIVVNDAANVR